jgi:hypothetical protein
MAPCRRAGRNAGWRGEWRASLSFTPLLVHIPHFPLVGTLSHLKHRRRCVVSPSSHGTKISEDEGEEDNM